MIEAQPYKGGKKGADSGIDGFLYFKPDGKTTENAVIEVKWGENVSPQWVRALGQVVECPGFRCAHRYGTATTPPAPPC